MGPAQEVPSSLFKTNQAYKPTLNQSKPTSPHVQNPTRLATERPTRLDLYLLSLGFAGGTDGGGDAAARAATVRCWCCDGGRGVERLARRCRGSDVGSSGGGYCGSALGGDPDTEAVRDGGMAAAQQWRSRLRAGR